MKLDEKYKPYLRRLLMLSVVTLLVITALNETVFILWGENRDRAPMEVELVIPAGTAEKIARGEEVLSIPDEMNFVLGDVLVVVNEDEHAHELGPVLVPPGSRSSLPLDDSDEYTYACSFRPNKYLGISVHPPTNFLTRLEGILFSLPATVVVIFLYSLLIRPVESRETSELMG